MITTTSPIPPLGVYPHAWLCGQVGITPTRIRIRIMSKIVQVTYSFSR